MARNQLQVLPEFALGLYSCLDALSLGASQVCGPDRGAFFSVPRNIQTLHRDFMGILMEISWEWDLIGDLMGSHV